jgi:hypothetical protein
LKFRTVKILEKLEVITAALLWIQGVADVKLTLKMKAVLFFETSEMICESTRHNTPVLESAGHKPF